MKELTTMSIWKCHICGLIFHEEWIASLHNKLSNHHSYRIGTSRS